MKDKLTCNQVKALINQYLQGTLNLTLQKYLENHIKICPHCQKKIQELLSVLSEFGKSKNETVDEKKRDYETIKRLSAYMDNELNQDENIKIKKMTISNTKVRNELENLYKFQKILHQAYNKTKNDSKYDYSKQIINRIQDCCEYSTTYFYKLAVIFAVLLTGIIAGFIYLYFGN